MEAVAIVGTDLYHALFDIEFNLDVEKWTLTKGELYVRFVATVSLYLAVIS